MMHLKNDEIMTTSSASTHLISALERNRQRVNEEEARKAFETAQEEWESVATVVPKYQEPGYSLDLRPETMGSSARGPVITPVLTFEEAFGYFQGLDTSQFLDNIKPTVDRKGLTAFLFCLFGPPKLEKDLIEQRNLVFCIAQCPLDYESAVHRAMLQTIYKKLTSTMIDCPLYGSHWEQIGFQGSDPSTDLRGVGVLGLLQLLALVISPDTAPMAYDIYKLSLDETQSFPFVVMSLNMTRMALQTLREGLLNRECNQQGEVMSVVNQFYAAVFYHIYKVWKTQHKTIKDSGFLLKDTEAYCKNNVRCALKDFQNHLNSYKVRDGEAAQKTSRFRFIRGSFQDLLIQAKSEVFI